MALSGVRDSAETVRDIVTNALIEIKVLEGGESASAEDAALGLARMKMMLRTWSIDGVRLWLTRQQSVTLVAGQAAYTLSPRVLEVRDAFRQQGDNDTPMRIFTREEYNSLPNKTVSGAPYALWPDRRLDSVVVTVYPVPQSGTTDTLSLTVKEVIQDVTDLNENLEVPPEWSECLMYNLAVRLGPAFQTQIDPVTAMMAQELYGLMKGQDRERSVRWRVRPR